VPLRREPDRPARPARTRRAAGPGTGGAAAAAAELPAAAAGLFEQLRAWRAAAAKEQGVPAYVIFHDATLRQIAVQRPVTLADLSAVGGVGEAKLARYGQQVLDTVAAASAGPGATQ
jgi:ATP-dependent DNA helicase RecQ